MTRSTPSNATQPSGGVAFAVGAVAPSAGGRR
ncbi:hypothetical protein BJ978_003155 [Agromyces terreus]|uniref:Uncharacterized protein n=1 Tax=Agromyces terreus TaxID=424795 RepID=A0A9X2HAL7_9MICO|nr:hypothetical protein [Agromyces terreus]